MKIKEIIERLKLLNPNLDVKMDIAVNQLLIYADFAEVSSLINKAIEDAKCQNRK